ncbi:glycosyl transferase [Clostridium gelidum]|uniref:Glycosyl transferase n=1 Tax=Clostridium gelidum TaxID=704125 RepID=A0ABM7TAA5_9CLOT|nr:glycosyltransferase family 2 protein [Clostridium gelidum]BCZ48245.1 glycosyl transferase [Clostridium gelidum]
MEPTLSIIVPIYQAEKSLHNCIQSILRQTMSNFELLLIDDGSKDKSSLICKEYLQKDKRIRFFEKSNSGVSETRNLGIKKASGKYIQFVDSDDTLVDYMCERMINTAEENNCELVICGYKKCEGYLDEVINYENLFINNMNNSGEIFGNLYVKELISTPWNKLFLKSKIKEYFDKNLSLGEDLVFNLEYMRNISSISIISDPLYNYFINPKIALKQLYKRTNYETILRGYTEVIAFCNEVFGVKYNSNLINQYFVKFVQGCFLAIVANKDNSQKLKLQQIKQIVYNEKLNSVCNTVNYDNRLLAFQSNLILNKNIYLIYYFQIIKRIIKNIKSNI